MHIDDELYRKMNNVYQYPDPNLVLLRSELSGVGIRPFDEYKVAKESETFETVDVKNFAVSVEKLKGLLNVSGLKDDDGNNATKEYMLNNISSVSFAEEGRNAESYYLNVLLDGVWMLCSYAKGERNESYDIVWRFTKPIQAAGHSVMKFVFTDVCCLTEGEYEKALTRKVCSYPLQCFSTGVHDTDYGRVNDGSGHCAYFQLNYEYPIEQVFVKRGEFNFVRTGETVLEGTDNNVPSLTKAEMLRLQYLLNQSENPNGMVCCVMDGELVRKLKALADEHENQQIQ